MNYKTAKRRYLTQKSAVKTKGRVDKSGVKILFKFTFEKWADIWEASGKWAQYGHFKGQYCMARYDDLGHYEVGNVYIRLHSENAGDSRRGATVSDETKERMRQAQLGKVHTEETKLKLREAFVGKPKIRVNCSLCGFETSKQNLSRHESACKRGAGHIGRVTFRSI